MKERYCLRCGKPLANGEEEHHSHCLEPFLPCQNLDLDNDFPKKLLDERTGRR